MVSGKQGEETLPLPEPGRMGDDTKILGTGGLAPLSDTLIGKCIAGRYTILGKLGQGGMGVVYRARDERLSRDVALKAIAPELRDDPEHIARLKHEAKVLASLHDPNIVTVYDVDADNGFLVMEFVDGISLAAVIEEVRAGRRTLSETTRVAIMLQVAEALDKAHKRLILHRDVKPANIIVAFEDEGVRVTVVDFGLSKATKVSDLVRIAGAPAPADVTTVDMIVGTPRYMPPEQALGELLDPRSDLYAFGITFAELLVLTNPTPGARPIEILSWLCSDEPISLPHALPTALRDLIVTLCAKDREKRPESAEEVVRVIRRWQEEREAHVQVEALLAGPVRDWRLVLHRREKAASELLRLERGARTEEGVLRHQELARLLTVLNDREKEGSEAQLRRRAATACTLALYGKPSPGEADRRRIARSFCLRALRDAERRRDRDASTDATNMLLLALGKERQGEIDRSILRRSRRIPLTTDPMGARVTLARYVQEGGRKVIGAEREDLGTTPCTIHVPRGEEWCLILERHGYRTIIAPVPSCGIRVKKLHFIFYTEEEIGGADWIHVPRGFYPIGGDPDALTYRPNGAVFLPDYFMERRPMTQARWAEILASLDPSEQLAHMPDTWASPSEPPHPNAPVVRMRVLDVFWYTEQYLRDLGVHAVPPSEEEIEAAIRGPHGNWFAWGDEEPDPSLIANQTLGISTLPDVGSFTPGGTPPGIDVSWCGLENSALVSTICRAVSGDMLLQAIEGGRFAARTGGHFQSTGRMFRACSRVALLAGDRPSFSGIRLVRYPRRPYKGKGSTGV